MMYNLQCFGVLLFLLTLMGCGSGSSNSGHGSSSGRYEND